MRRLPNRLTGTSKTESWLNQLRDAVVERTPMRSHNQRLIRQTGGFRTIPDAEEVAAASPGGTVKQYRLKQVLPDVLRCRTWDGVTEGDTDIYIAKPPELRRTATEGLTISYEIENWPNPVANVNVSYTFQSNTFRTANKSGIIEKQIVVPRFRVDHSIIFASTVEGGTGVTVAGQAVDLIDNNNAARAWTRTNV